MYHYGASAEIPLCPLGHYAARRDLQSALYLNHDGDICVAQLDEDADEEAIQWEDDYILEHFDISEAQGEVLFGLSGCGHADTAEESARFIEGFVALFR